MYIIGMRYGKNIEKLEMTPTEILVGVVIPFVLFWGGMLSPVFSDSVIVWILSLAPFYGYVFVSAFASSKKYADLFAGDSMLNLITSIVISLLLFVIPEDWVSLIGVCKLSILNIAPAFAFCFVCLTNRFVESIKGTPFPVFPFFMGGGS